MSSVIIELQEKLEFMEDSMARVIEPKDTTREPAYNLWMKAPNPMVTFFKTLDVTNLVKVSKKKNLKFNMLLNYCIQYDNIAVNTIVKNKCGEVNSCDILYNPNLDEFNKEYLQYTTFVSTKCEDRDLSSDCMVIGTSAIIDTEIDGAVGMNSGIFNNPFMIWGKYRKKFLRFYLPISFQFHHTQMDGAHAGRFLANLQNEIKKLK